MRGFASDSATYPNWAASCGAGDLDYEIYEGSIGDFTGHVAVECSTGGATTMTISPVGGNTYYLVVPNNGYLEGSYGQNNFGDERAQGGSACFPRSIGACQ